MGTVTDVLNYYENLERRIPDIVADILRRNETKILDLNRKDQLFNEGINRLGRIVGRYSAATESITGGRKKAGDPYNFFDTGDFYKNFKYDFNKETFRIDIYSVDSKTPLLVLKYSENIFGLTKSNQHKLDYEIILPELQKAILK